MRRSFLVLLAASFAAGPAFSQPSPDPLYQKKYFAGESCLRCHSQIRERGAGPDTAAAGPEALYDPQAYDVIIVGGGLSGLASAYYLRGLKVLVLDKEDAVGGKARSQRWGDKAYGVAADFMVTPYWKPIADLLKDLKIESFTLPRPTNAFMTPDGREIADPLTAGLPRLAATPRDRQRLARMVKDLTAFDAEPVLGNMPPVPLKLPGRGVKLDEVGFKAYMRRNYGPAAIPGFPDFADRYALSLSGAADVSALYGLSMISTDFTDATNITWDGGTGVLAEKLAAAVGPGNLRTRALVTAVRPDGSVEYYRGRRRRIARAKAVVMTVPSFVAAKLLSGMPPWKTRALAAVRYSAYAKAIIALDKPFDLGAFDLWSMRKTVFSDLVDERWGRPEAPAAAPGAPVKLVDAYIPLGGDDGRRYLLQVSDQELAGRVAKDFLSLFPKISPGDIHGIRIIRWGHAMPVDYPGYLTRIRPQVERPVGRIFFAGVDTQMPCIEGAISSGYFAARQVRDYLARGQAGR